MPTLFKYQPINSHTCVLFSQKPQAKDNTTATTRVGAEKKNAHATNFATQKQLYKWSP